LFHPSLLRTWVGKSQAKQDNTNQKYFVVMEWSMSQRWREETKDKVKDRACEGIQLGGGVASPLSIFLFV
jgi:hypothetical protein